MQVIADLQLHSRFSRAVSQQMTIPNIAIWAARKGIGLVATGDWTHPLWFLEIERDLEEVGNGLLKLRTQNPRTNDQKNPLFLLATEVSCIYSQGGKVRRVHTLIWVPALDSARKINQEMTKRGCNLMSDGRPIIGLTSIQVAELVLSVEPKALIIPAHAWTPWFSVYGSLGGFDSLDEAFGPFAKNIYAVETGLSSNPAMNWRIKELDSRSIVSFSDAHSGPKIGREATVFELNELSYSAIYKAVSEGPLVGSHFARSVKVQPSPSPSGSGAKAVTELENTHPPSPHIAYTIEFYPEEGKYHYTGHREHGIRWSPAETNEKGTTCPVCGKPLTQGVMQRIEELASRSEKDLKLSTEPNEPSSGKVSMIFSESFPGRPPFVMLVPLQEILAEAIGSPAASPKVQIPYGQLVDGLGGEFLVLLTAPSADIAKITGERVAQGVEKVRRGDIVIDPGYDGVFGVVKIWKEGEKSLVDEGKEQLSLLS